MYCLVKLNRRLDRSVEGPMLSMSGSLPESALADDRPVASRHGNWRFLPGGQAPSREPSSRELGARLDWPNMAFPSVFLGRFGLGSNATVQERQKKPSPRASQLQTGT